jgi:hypothetical protein
MGFPSESSQQREEQGALICQDWPGPEACQTPVAPEHFLAAADIADGARLKSLIAFFVACYGAGTPEIDGFEEHRSGKLRRHTDAAFVARLPQRLLAHPQGGALAVISHVDRAWTYSFDWPEVGAQTQVYEDCLAKLLRGYPVGAAMECFGQRYAELSTVLAANLEEVEHGVAPDLLDLAGLWTANNDARSYIVLGDPAVRLPATNPAVEASTEARP